MKRIAICSAMVGLAVASVGAGCGVIPGLSVRPGVVVPRGVAASEVQSGGERAGGERARGQSASGQSASGDQPRLSDADMVLPEPGPGIERVEPMSPPWCAELTDYPTGKNSGGGFSRGLAQLSQYGWNDGMIANLAPYTCANPDDANYRKQTAGLIQGWANTYGLTREQAIAAITLRVHKTRWEASKQEFCEGELGGLDEEASLDEQMRYQTVQHAICTDDWQNGPGRSSDPFAWYYDRLPDAPSELARARFLIRCFGVHGEPDPQNYHQLASYAMCGHDAELADRKKLAQEIKGYNAYARTRALEFHGMAIKRARMFKAAAQARAKRNPELARILLELPKATYAEWRRTYADHEPAIRAALDFEAKFLSNRRSATRGCWAPLHRQLVRHVASQRPKTIEDVERAATDPVATLLTERLVVCAAREKRVDTGYIPALNDIAPEARGWHVLLMQRIIAAVNDVREERPRFPLDPKEHFFGQGMSPSPLFAMVGKIGSSGSSRIEAPNATAEVVSVEAARGNVTATYKGVPHRDPVYKCKRTNRIARIRFNGDVEYEERCWVAEWKTRIVTPPATTTDRNFAHGIRRGALVQLAVESLPSVSRVYAVYETPAKKKLVNALGFPMAR